MAGRRKSSKQITITVGDAHLHDLDRVLKDLERSGLKNGQALRSIGTITGHVAPEDLPKLSKIAGVSNVEESADYQLPPGDSDVQ